MCLKQRMSIILPYYYLRLLGLEDNTESLSAQQDLFGDFLLPCAAKFLTE